MKFKIHRGTKEIGGSCVEIWTDTTRILVDFGMPLVEKDGSEFDFRKYKELDTEELIKQSILPNIEGLYKNSEDTIDGVVISHAHQDHYGLINFITKEIKFYLGEATHKIIELNNIFTPQNIVIDNYAYFEREKTFSIGDILITPYWADHSAFDSYSFLIEADGKSIFYSGDFRGHGRKSRVFKWFTHNAPQNVDYLLLEGTTIGRGNKPSKTEEDVENELIKVFEEKKGINLVYTSGQNIDRLVSIFKACLSTNKILVVDVYVAYIMKELSPYIKIPNPAIDSEKIKVIFPYYTCKRLKDSGYEQILFQFKDNKIKKEEIGNHPDQIVMIVRPSMQKDLGKIEGIDGGNLIYSMWEGYMKKSNTKKFIDYLTGRGFSIRTIHTSGHADIEALKMIVDAIKPKSIVPIHTFSGSDYNSIFAYTIVEMHDGKSIEI
jgi:ribonuclease J